MESLILQHIMVSWLLELRNLPLTTSSRLYENMDGCLEPILYSDKIWILVETNLVIVRLIPGDTKLDDDYSNHLIVGSDIRR